MAGYPGAGKTTIAKIINELTGAVHLSSDAIRLELFPSPTFSPNEHMQLYKTLDDRTASLLKQGKDVIYDANLNRYQHRQEKYDICSQLNADARLIWVQTERSLAKQRATHISRTHLAPVHETLETMFERIADVIETPKVNEEPIIIDGNDTNRAEIKHALGL